MKKEKARGLRAAAVTSADVAVTPLAVLLLQICCLVLINRLLPGLLLVLLPSVQQQQPARKRGERR